MSRTIRLFLVLFTSVCLLGSGGENMAAESSRKTSLWSFVDGGGKKGINRDPSWNAASPRLAGCKGKLYAAWIEWNGAAQQVRIAVYNGNDGSPAWTLVDGGGLNGVNRAAGRDARSPYLAEYGGKLYAVWDEWNGTSHQVRAAVYNGNDHAPAWTFLDSGVSRGINLDPGRDAADPRFTVFNSRLYALWKEKPVPSEENMAKLKKEEKELEKLKEKWSEKLHKEAKAASRSKRKSEKLEKELEELDDEIERLENRMQGDVVAMYNGNDASPSWKFIDSGLTGIKRAYGEDALRKSFTPGTVVSRSRLYKAGQRLNENVYRNPKKLNENAYQIQVESFDKGSWTAVEGKGPNGINRDYGMDGRRSSLSPELAVIDSALYAAWHEEKGSGSRIHAARYNGNDASPVWTPVDGGDHGINKDPAQPARDPMLAVFNSKLYAVWAESNGAAYQIRAAVLQPDHISHTTRSAADAERDVEKRIDEFCGKGPLIWKGKAGARRICSFRSDVQVFDRNGNRIFALHEKQGFGYEGRPDENLDVEVVSLVGDYMGLKITALDGAVRFLTVDLLRPSKDVSLRDLYPEEDFIEALKADPVVREHLRQRGVKAETLDDFDSLWTILETAFVPNLLNCKPESSFAFYDYSENKVRIRFAGIHGKSYRRPAQLEIVLNAPERLAPALRKAAHREDGFLMKNRPNTGGRRGIFARTFTKVSGWAASGTKIAELKSIDHESSPRAAMDPAGNAVTVWSDSEDRKDTPSVYASVYSAGAKAWGPAKRLGKGEYPEIVVDEAGNAVVVWCRENGDIFAAGYASKTGAWTAPKIIGKGQYPRIASDAKGNVIAVWMLYEGAAVPSIYTNVYSAQTKAWGAAKLIGKGNYPAIAMNSAGNCIIAFREGNDIRAYRYSAGSKTWGEGEFVATWDQYPVIAMDGEGNAVIVSKQENSGELHASTYQAEGAQWGRTENIGSSAGLGEQPVAASIGTGVVVSEQGGQIRSAVYSSKSGGWDTSLSPSRRKIGKEKSPSVVVDSAGNAVALWSGLADDGKTWNLYAGSYSAKTQAWGTPQLIEKGLGPSADFGIAMSKAGSAVTVWSRMETRRQE